MLPLLEIGKTVFPVLENDKDLKGVANLTKSH